jgi:acetate kinase
MNVLVLNCGSSSVKFQLIATESLPAIVSCRAVSSDPAEDARLDAEYYARNQTILKMLDAKGFGFQGDEPGGVLINRYLHSEKVP